MAKWNAVTIASWGAAALLGIGIASLLSSKRGQPDIDVIETDQGSTTRGPGMVGGGYAHIGSGVVAGNKEVRGQESGSAINNVHYGVGSGPRPDWAGSPWPTSQPMTKIAAGVVGI